MKKKVIILKNIRTNFCKILKIIWRYDINIRKNIKKLEMEE